MVKDLCGIHASSSRNRLMNGLYHIRWWPAQICNPRDVPTNIQNMRHQPGEFPVMFLGSHDYYWIHRGRVFSYQEGDKGSTDSGNSKHLAKIFKKGKQGFLLLEMVPKIYYRSTCWNRPGTGFLNTCSIQQIITVLLIRVCTESGILAEN